MELRELAERILQATNLEDKLATPLTVTDAHPGPPFHTPQAPGRPAELRFRSSESARAEFPGLHRLDDETQRGRILHFFANHELLATELMALVLLRFPDAPPAFRRGVLQTLRDEQEHTRLYLQRMEACGVQFGDLPVSGYIWRAVSSMETPLDYVATLSLTFEQANLDFCREFARGFRDVGDLATAQLLDRIHHDEIGHVAYGLKWFRRWKDPSESDWDVFRRHLKFPLTPQRAKGHCYQADSRLAAGLDPDFIAELEVYSQSRGRTPTVFVFNPFTEARLARGPGHNPTRPQADLARDLANLPQFLCRQDDVVLLPRRPSLEFLSGIRRAGFVLPEFVELDNDPGLRGLAGRKIGGLRPWAWGPDSLELLSPLIPDLPSDAPAPDRSCTQATRVLYSKAWSAAFLRRILTTEGGRREPWCCTDFEIGVVVHSLDEALEAIHAIRSRGHVPIVLKQAYGLAGQNALRLWEPSLLESQRRWIERSVGDGEGLVAEPWLDREADFSLQLEMRAGGLECIGHTGLVNDHRGQFQANWASSDHRRRIPHGITDLLAGSPARRKDIHDFYASILARLETDLRTAGFLGPLGIDALVYRTPQGGRRLKPIVEINPRFTMGRLTVELMRRVSPGSHGAFRIVSHRMAHLAGAEDLPSYARSLKERFPLRLEGQPTPRILEGALCLNDPAQATACLAVFQVSRILDPASLGLETLSAPKPRPRGSPDATGR